MFITLSIILNKIQTFNCSLTLRVQTAALNVFFGCAPCFSENNNCASINRKNNISKLSKEKLSDLTYKSEHNIKPINENNYNYNEKHDSSPAAGYNQTVNKEETKTVLDSKTTIQNELRNASAIMPEKKDIEQNMKLIETQRANELSCAVSIEIQVELENKIVAIKHVDLEWGQKFLSDILEIYFLKRQFFSFLIYACDNNIEVKISSIFNPKTLNELLSMYVFMTCDCFRENPDKTHKIMQIALKQKSLRNYTKQLKEYKNDILLPPKLQSHFFSVNKCLANKKIPNKNITRLIKTKSYNTMKNIIFCSINMFRQDINEIEFPDNNTDIFYSDGKVSINIRKDFLKKLIKDSHNKFNLKVEEQVLEELKTRDKCVICKAIKLNDEQKKKYNIFQKTFAVKKTSSNPTMLFNKKFSFPIKNDSLKEALIVEFRHSSNVIYSHVSQPEFEWIESVFSEIFDFLFIKQEINKIKMYFKKNDEINKEPTSTDNNKKLFDFFAEIYFLYEEKNLTDEVGEKTSRKAEYTKSSVVDKFSIILKKHIAESQNEQLYKLLYEANTSSDELNVLQDYFNNITIYDIDINMKENERNICRGCIIESEARMYISKGKLIDVIQLHNSNCYNRLEAYKKK
ncbi:hypothetical protein CDIK_2449 [Cucumispora dikerogammari]|nr:hypothetical protein CDIK_2449 [Cucumispora dikerogammari]